eukprot:m.188488 g.188488  ORF g.188488 m.188488 type:complete len:393 (+) comp18528_c0_seq14:663-1841(+)
MTYKESSTLVTMTPHEHPQQQHQRQTTTRTPFHLYPNTSPNSSTGLMSHLLLASTVTLKEGVIQGDPLAGLYFTLPLAEILERNNNIADICFHLAYIDDNIFAGTMDHILDMVQHTTEKIAKLGLKWAPKTQLYTTNKESFDSPQFEQQLTKLKSVINTSVSLRANNISNIQAQGLSIIGFPLGSKQFKHLKYNKQIDSTSLNTPIFRSLTAQSKFQLTQYTAVSYFTHFLRAEIDQEILDKTTLSKFDDQIINSNTGLLFHHVLGITTQKYDDIDYTNATFRAQIPTHNGGLGLYSSKTVAQYASTAAWSTYLRTPLAQKLGTTTYHSRSILPTGPCRFPHASAYRSPRTQKRQTAALYLFGQHKQRNFPTTFTYMQIWKQNHQHAFCCRK